MGGRPKHTGTRPKCPYCGSSDSVKTGIARPANKASQQVWFCRQCSRTWRETIPFAEPFTDEMWEMFLAGGSKCFYQLRRACAKCGHPITDGNRSGLCARCMPYSKKELELPRRKLQKGESTSNQSKEHYELEQRAVELLGDLGCEEIEKEVRFFYSAKQCEEKGVRRGTGIQVDVLGRKDGEIIAIECGGSQRRKLLKTLDFVDTIYILPYGEAEPFLWSKEVRVCGSCGHKV